MEYTTLGPDLKPLLLIGGKSTRMGTPKHLLPLPNGTLAIERALATLHSAVPTAPVIYISVNSSMQVPAIHDRLYAPGSLLNPTNLNQNSRFPEIMFLLDDHEDIGPAAGLLAAFKKHGRAKWMVIGCDYPLLPLMALQQLVQEFRDPVTCFIYEAGFVEPLIGIWGPEALEKLERNVEEGKSGLNDVVSEVSGNTVKPIREEWIFGTKTREEWECAMQVLRLDI